MVVVVVSLSSPQCLSRPRSKQKYAVVVASSPDLPVCHCLSVGSYFGTAHGRDSRDLKASETRTGPSVQGRPVAR